MIRQFFRLILIILVGFKNLVFRSPGVLGFAVGSVMGLAMGIWMVRYGFPAITIPISTLAWGIGIAPSVNEFLEKITK